MRILTFTLSLLGCVLFFSTTNLNNSSVIFKNTSSNQKSAALSNLANELHDADQPEWSNWTRLDDCFQGIDFRVQKGAYNEYAKKYNWRVQFRNRYQQKVYFSYEVVPYSERNQIRQSGKTTNRTSVEANATQSGAHWGLIAESSRLYVLVNSVRFGQDGLQPYAKCDM